MINIAHALRDEESSGNARGVRVAKDAADQWPQLFISVEARERRRLSGRGLCDVQLVVHMKSRDMPIVEGVWRCPKNGERDRNEDKWRDDMKRHKGPMTM